MKKSYKTTVFLLLSVLLLPLVNGSEVTSKNEGNKKNNASAGSCSQGEKINISNKSDDYETIYRSLSSKADKEQVRKGVYYLSKDPLPRRVLNWSLPGHKLSTLEEADRWIEEQLSKSGYEYQLDSTRVRAFGRDLSKPLAHQYSTPPPDAPYYTAHNIIAGKKGTANPDQLIIIIAHKDSQSWIASPGANDNAIGTCCTLELARLLKSYSPRHSIRFIFCNEEHTPWTSPTAAKNIRESGKEVLAVINMDAIGGKPDERKGHSDNVMRYTTPEGERLADLAISLNRQFATGLEQSKFRSDAPGDDDGSFIKEGFPWSVLNIGSMPYGDPNYHLESDTADKVDYETAVKVVKLTLAMILNLDFNGRP